MTNTYTDDERRAALQWVAGELGHPPKTKEYRTHKQGDMPSEIAITRLYSNERSPWLSALRDAGLDADPKEHNANPTKNDIKKSLAWGAAELTEWPSPDQYRELGLWPSVPTIYDRYASWGAARDAAKTEYRLIDKLVAGETVNAGKREGTVRLLTEKVRTDDGAELRLVGDSGNPNLSEKADKQD